MEWLSQKSASVKNRHLVTHILKLVSAVFMLLSTRLILCELSAPRFLFSTFRPSSSSSRPHNNQSLNHLISRVALFLCGRCYIWLFFLRIISTFFFFSKFILYLTLPTEEVEPIASVSVYPLEMWLDRRCTWVVWLVLGRNCEYARRSPYLYVSKPQLGPHCHQDKWYESNCFFLSFKNIWTEFSCSFSPLWGNVCSIWANLFSNISSCFILAFKNLVLSIWVSVVF